MGAAILTFLSKIKLMHWLILGLVLLSLLVAFLFNSLKKEKAESERQEQNYEQLRDFDQKKIASLEFKNKIEFEDYLNSSQKIRDLLNQQKKENNIKIKQLNSVIYQQQIHIDTTSSKENVTEIVKYIREDKPFKKYWTDSTKCLILKGNLTYKNNSLISEITYKKFTNEMILTGHWLRPQKNWFTRNFGKRYATSTVTSTCGETKTIILNKK